MSDDAFIALRAVDNFVSGHGLVSNPGERAQGFTSPLWVLLLSVPYAVTREPYFTVIVASVALSMTSVTLLLRAGVRSAGRHVFPVVVLTFSRAFTDYATSGLENALSTLLLCGFALVYFGASARRPDPTLKPYLLGALVVLTRFDHALLIAPAIIEYSIRHRRRGALYFAVGMAPVLGWLCFALFYYGLPLPVTAYAKLNVGIPRHVLIAQGFAYFMDSIARDPITLLTIVSACVLGAATRRPVALWLALGIALYLVYVLVIGGDFMSSRFLVAPLVVAVALLALSVLPRLQPNVVRGAWIGLGLVIVSMPFNPLSPVVEPCAVPDHGVVDERSCYYEHTGLLRNLHRQASWGYQTHPYFKDGVAKRQSGKRVHVTMLVGLAGYAAGPRVHLIDQAALTDPYLAQLRFPWRPEDRWRIGHFYRDIPAGYVESVERGENLVRDRCLRRLYTVTRLVTQGSLWSWSRLREAFRLNLGQYDDLRRACGEEAHR